MYRYFITFFMIVILWASCLSQAPNGPSNEPVQPITSQNSKSPEGVPSESGRSGQSEAKKDAGEAPEETKLSKRLSFPVLDDILKEIFLVESTHAPQDPFTIVLRNMPFSFESEFEFSNLTVQNIQPLWDFMRKKDEGRYVYEAIMTTLTFEEDGTCGKIAITKPMYNIVICPGSLAIAGMNQADEYLSGALDGLSFEPQKDFTDDHKNKFKYLMSQIESSGEVKTALAFFNEFEEAKIIHEIIDANLVEPGIFTRELCDYGNLKQSHEFVVALKVPEINSAFNINEPHSLIKSVSSTHPGVLDVTQQEAPPDNQYARLRYQIIYQLDHPERKGLDPTSVLIQLGPEIFGPDSTRTEGVTVRIPVKGTAIDACIPPPPSSPTPEPHADYATVLDISSSPLNKACRTPNQIQSLQFGYAIVTNNHSADIFITEVEVACEGDATDCMLFQFACGNGGIPCHNVNVWCDDPNHLCDSIELPIRLEAGKTKLLPVVRPIGNNVVGDYFATGIYKGGLSETVSEPRELFRRRAELRIRNRTFGGECSRDMP
jgi:hypothetical protein